jgi:nitrogen regulatory protein P-II 2
MNKMKLVIAYIQPERLNEVKKALFEQGIYKMSATTALGCGQQKGFHENYRGVDTEVNLLKKLRLEIAVNDDHVDNTIEAITKGAKTGNIGDGKIFVLDMVKCVRIRTNETGAVAIG